MASIRVRDDGSAPIVAKGRESPFKQGEYYVWHLREERAFGRNQERRVRTSDRL